MRAAAILATTIIAVGLFLTVAAMTSLAPTWIGVGCLALAVAGAFGIMVDRSPAPERSAAG